jgi:hypothetical protein
MDFPIQPFMDEDACYQFLLDLLHPVGLHCPRCQTQEGFVVHRYYFYCNRFKNHTTAQLVSPCERRGGNVPVAWYQW